MSLNVKFSATDVNFTDTVSKIKEEIDEMDDEVKKTSKGVQTSFGSMVKAGAALAVGFGAIKVAANAITGTFGTFKDALDLGGTMADLSARTGETAGNLMLLRRAFDNSGVGAEKVGTSVNKLQKFMDDAAQGSEKNNTVLARLGLTMADMAGKTPTEQMGMLAEKLNGVTDNGERSALAMSVFGKAGGQLLPLLADFSSGMQTAQDQLGSMPGVLDRSSGAFDNISDNITVAKGKFLEFAAGLLESLAPALELATTLITRFDAAGAGMKLGEIITGASNAMGGFTDALSAIKLGEFGLAFKIAFESIKLQAADSINSIAANVMAAVQASGAFLLAAFGPGSGIFTIIEAQINKLSLNLKLAFEEANPFGDQLNIDGLKQAIASSERLIGTAMGVIGEDFTRAGQELTKTFDQALGTSKQLIDTSETEVKLQEHRVELKKIEAEASSAAAKEAAAKVTAEEKSVKIIDEVVKANKDELATKKQITKEIEKQVGLGAKIIADANAAQRKDQLDPGGRLEKQAAEATGKGNFTEARRIGRQLQRRDLNRSFKDLFGSGQDVEELAKLKGIETRGKTSNELKKEIMQKRQEEMKPKKEAEEAKRAADKPENILQKSVDAIKTAVEKLEKKLPMPALGF